MALLRLAPNGDGSRVNWVRWDGVTFQTTFLYTAIDEFPEVNDTVYILSQNTNAYYFTAFPAIPLNARIKSVTSRIIFYASAGTMTGVNVAIFKSDEATALTDLKTFNVTSQELKSFTFVPTSNKSSDWSGCRMRFGSGSTPNGTTYISALAMELNIEYDIAEYFSLSNGGF